jgi:hypothetical protein
MACAEVPRTDAVQESPVLLYFCFACVAYAMWKLADFRAKKDLGIPLEDEEGRTTDSVVEFEEFLETLEEYLGIEGDFLHEPG